MPIGVGTPCRLTEGFAVAQLSTDDFINTTSFVATRLPRMTSNASLYITFDPYALKTDPVVGASAGDVR